MELSVHSDGTEMSPEMDVIFTARNEGNIFRSVCQEFCPLGGGGRGGVHGRRACMTGGACVVGGMCGRTVCMVGCVAGGVHRRGHAWHGVCMVGCAWQGA